MHIKIHSFIFIAIATKRAHTFTRALLYITLVIGNRAPYYTYQTGSRTGTTKGRGREHWTLDKGVEQNKNRTKNKNKKNKNKITDQKTVKYYDYKNTHTHSAEYVLPNKR